MAGKEFSPSKKNTSVPNEVDLGQSEMQEIHPRKSYKEALFPKLINKVRAFSGVEGGTAEDI